MGVQKHAKRARQEVRAREQAETDRLPPWTPFERATPYMHPVKREAMIRETMELSAKHGRPVTRETVEDMMDNKLNQEMYRNSRYTVIVLRDEPQDPDTPRMIHLSIRRNDRARPREERYRDFQRIKTELVGPDYEGVELYPREDRVADCADQYHLFVLADSEMQFGFGFTTGMRAGPTGGPAAQSPFED